MLLIYVKPRFSGPHFDGTGLPCRALKVKAGTAMSDRELVEWNDVKQQPDGKTAIQKASETLYATMALMTDDASEGGRAMNIAVDTGDISPSVKASSPWKSSTTYSSKMPHR